MLLGAATTTAVMTGALLVGDSMRGSLEDLALNRLGAIEHSIESSRFLDARLALKIPAAVPIILVKGSARHGETRARATGVTFLGVDERFAALYPGGPGRALPAEAPGAMARGGPQVRINETLRRDLGARVGDPILLSFPKTGEAPADTLLGRRRVEDLVGTLRGTITEVIPDSGPGRFSLLPDQRDTRIAYLALAEFQQAMGQTGKCNVILLGHVDRPAVPLEKTLADAIDLDAMGLVVSRTDQWVSIESRDFVLSPGMLERIEAAAGRLAARVSRIQTYLTNSISHARRTVVYSTITAVDPAGTPFPWLELVDGTPARHLAEDEILINEWVGKELEAKPGDTIELSFFVVGPHEELHTESAAFRLAGIVAMTGLGADRALTPEYPGIRNMPDLAAWDPPFPVDLSKIQPRDEEYWDRFGATPKAFVSEATGRRLWSTRYGATTSLRIAPAAGSDMIVFSRNLTTELRSRLPLDLAGLRLRAVRQEALAAAAGSTDFGVLFLAFSGFLIISCALLCGLLFRLGVERRSREIGVLLAIGYRIRAVRGRLLAQGVALAGGGVSLGLAGGILYAGMLMHALRTIWRDAVGSSELHLHVDGGSLVMGGILSFGVVVLAVTVSVRRLSRIPIPALLAGEVTHGRATRPGGSSWLAGGGLLAGAALAIFATATDRSSSPALSFGIGAAMLAGGLGLFGYWCRVPGRRLMITAGRSAMILMAGRNCSRNPGRSILSVTLIACACFVIVTVAASRHAGEPDGGGRQTGAGGYTLVGESEIALHQDLNSEKGRFDLGMPASARDTLAGSMVTPFRLVPGDDASCLNLYQALRPRLLGVPPSQVERGGFRFSQVASSISNPWKLLEMHPEPGVIPAIGDENSVRWILHLGLGQDLVVRDELGEPLRLRFVGLLSSSLFGSEILIPETELISHFPSRSGHSFFLIETPAGAQESVSRLLEESLSPQGFDVSRVMDRIASYRVVENTYLSTFGVLGGLGLLLGTIGLGIVVVFNIIERRAELAAMRAFGFARFRLALLVVAENAFLLFVGMTIGSFAAACAVIPRLAGGGSDLAWAPLIATLAAVFLTGMVSTFIAVKAALAAPLIPVLKAER